jgi:hypothetical protein
LRQRESKIWDSFQKGKKQQMIDPIANVQLIVKELDVPSWLQADLLTVLKSKQ